MARKTYPLATLALLTAINFVNYIDRSVLFAVQALVQAEFKFSDTKYGLLTTFFFIFYMAVAPFVGMAADRYSRKKIVFSGIFLWSGATLLTALAHNYSTLLIRHTVVAIGESSYATIAPALLADLFPEERRGRMLSIFYLAIPVGTAMGYILAGSLIHRFSWRAPFYVAALPGFLLALAFLLLPEPKRGLSDHLAATPDRATFRGLAHNGAFWTATLGMAMMTFALGGVSVFLPKFLSQYRGMSLEHANLFLGASIGANGIVATLFGGWLGDRLLRKSDSAYYLVSAAGMTLGIPAMAMALYRAGPPMMPAIVLAEFLLLMNTGPLNAAIVNSVSAKIRSSAIGVNLIVIHLLGDAFSPPLMGYISDRSSLPNAFIAAVGATALSAAVLFYGMRYAPRLGAARLHALGAET
jgi:MFS transporter, Spinster family, sphingosine-1-phosphate transporter